MVNGKQENNIVQRNFSPGMILLILFVILNSPIWPAAKHALLIGINDYQLSGLENLKGTENDLALIKNVLQENLGFQAKEISILKNKNATHSGLKKAFSQLAHKINKEDFVYIHYCGHSSQTPDNNGDEYPGTFDQTWVPYGSRSNLLKGEDRYDITDDELHQWLLPIFKKTTQVIIVSDSCYSAGVTRGNIMSARSVSPDNRQYPSLAKIVVNKECEDGILIGAAQDDELAFEAIFEGKFHGLFSWYWLNALKKACPGDTWSDVFQRSYIMVSNYFDQQHPQFQGDLNKPVFAGDNKKCQPRVPISRVWRNGKEVCIEAGSLSGVYAGAKFRLYHPLDINNPDLPCLEVTKVTPFSSKAVANGPFKFKIGDLVIPEPHCHMIEMLRVRANRFKQLVAPSSFNIDLAITLWLPTKEPKRNGDVYLEPPGHLGLFKKEAVFDPAEIEAKQALPAGSLLTFQVKNQGPRDCYIYLLELKPDGGAEAVFPQPGDRRQKAWLPAGRKLDFQNIFLLLLDRPGRETIKLIAAEAPINVAFLTQEAPRMEGRGLTQKWGTIQFSILIDK